MARILLEIVASTVEDCLAAESGGADRIELCEAIEAGGLTPPVDTLRMAKRRINIPVMAMVRPRAGGFCYSEAEFAVMLRDAELLIEHGADGIVFGILCADRTVDRKRCANIVEIAGEKQTVFHRAFDETENPRLALDELIALRFTRVLTSGQQETALAGRAVIGQLIKQAVRRIEVLPGGGIRGHNVRELVEVTGCTQVHMTAFGARINGSTSNAALNLGGISSAAQSSYECVDREVVHQMRDLLDEIGNSR